MPLIEQSKWCIRTGSFSKNFSMSGWRVGYMAVPPHLTDALGKMQDALLNCTNVPAQYAALYALENTHLIKPFQDAVKKSKIIAQQLLAPLVEQKIISYQEPAGGFNLFIKLHTLNATIFCEELVQKAKVTLVPGKAFGPACDDYFRLCYARDPNVVEAGVKRIVEMLIALQSNSITEHKATAALL
jgi:aspartate/methionine/tyrosine aminotransferase